MLLNRMFLASLIWMPLRSVAQTQSANTTETCDVSPFALEIKEQQLDSGLPAWGVLFQIGNRPQRVILVPSTVTNSTLLNQNLAGGLCDLSNTTIQNQCESIRGGFFNQNASSTWQPADLKTSNISREEPTWEHFNQPKDVPGTLGIAPITEIGYDDIRIRGNTDFVLHGAGLALNQRGNQSNAGMLGLGLDSVFLDDVVAQNRSPSRSWGLDSGSRSDSRGRQGELVIGGWNEQRVDGEWFEFDIDPSKFDAGSRSCPLLVKMAELTLISEDGENSTELMESAYSIDACVEPYDNHFRWTKEMIENWKRETGFDETLVDPYTTSDEGLAFIEPGLPYEQNKTKMWQLRIKLDNGYSTTITYDEMQRPLQGWNKNGQLQTVNGISNVAIFNKPTDKGETPTLGKIFLSRSYLRVDYEKMKFYLARADTTATPADSQLVAMRAPSCDAPQTTSEPQKDSRGTPVGPIIGGVVGGIAGAILFIAFLIWFGKRRRNRLKKRQEMALRPSSRPGNNDLEPATNGSHWPWYIGPPVGQGRMPSHATTSNGQDRVPSYATTSNGQGLLSGAGVSPRTSAQDMELREDRVHSNTSDRPPMSPTSYTTPAELEATKSEDV